MNEPYHPFKSEKAKEIYLTFNDEHTKRWPVTSENRYVETSYGQTFVRINRLDDKPPLVLLPGDTENSLSWIPQIVDFSKQYSVYAVDNIYDNGRSIYSQPLKKPADFVAWLDELFYSLGLKNDINLLGFSYGGWITSLYAFAHPERLKKVVLISAAATIFPRIKYLIAGMLAHFFPNYFFTKRIVYLERKCLVKQGDVGRAIADHMIKEVIIAGKCFKKRKFVSPTIIKKSNLQNLKVPVLYLIGEQEVMFSAKKVVNHLNKVAPQVKTVIIPDASHDITHSQATLVNKKILDFLQEE